jgi:hypothetical protein
MTPAWAKFACGAIFGVGFAVLNTAKAISLLRNYNLAIIISLTL